MTIIKEVGQKHPVYSNLDNNLKEIVFMLYKWLVEISELSVVQDIRVMSCKIVFS